MQNCSLRIFADGKGRMLAAPGGLSLVCAIDPAKRRITRNAVLVVSDKDGVMVFCRFKQQLSVNAIIDDFAIDSASLQIADDL